MCPKSKARKLLLLAAVLLPAAHAQFIQQGNKLVGSGAFGSPSQGSAVAVSADGATAIVGGYYDAFGVGAAWVYVRANGIWSQQGPKLVGAGATGNALQGLSVAISGDGNTAIVGGPDDDHDSFAGPAAGAAWVFTRTNGVWGQQGPKLIGAGAGGNAGQGFSVAISGDGNTALVGGPGANNSIPFTPGAAWVFTRTSGVWSQQGPKLTGTGAAVGNPGQGVSVALSADGNTAVVGGYLDNQNTGAIWVFTRTNGVWNQQGPKLVGTGVVGVGGTQGQSVGLSGDGNTAISGASAENQGIGAAWVFTRTNGVWSQMGNKLVGAGGVGVQYQGSSVALSGDGHTAIVGGISDHPLGAAWVYVSAPMHLVVSAPSSVTAGTPFSFTVTALDTNNSIVTGYTGTVHFSTTDPIGNLPPDSMLINGMGMFTATLKTGNFLSPVIVASDTVNPSTTGSSAPIGVQAGATSTFAFSATPSTSGSGVPFSFILSAYDQFGNFAASNTAHVHFTSSDAAAILPADSLMPAGVATFSAILMTAGNQTITASDTGNSSITGTSNPILITGSSTISNLAQGRTATQSSTLLQTNAVASQAVDGNTDGNFGDGSVTATGLDANAWWQVDLGSSAAVSSIVIWNRTDCCGSRLSNYWVFVSDTPFGPTDTPATLQNRAGTFSSNQGLAPNPSTTIAVGAHGRYVRVQLSGADYLSLAEVQVFGTPGIAPASLATGKAATQSSTYAGSAGVGSAVDGNTDGNFFHGSVTATNADTNAWWQVDLGASATVNTVVIWNRTDCCAPRLGDYWVFVSNVPFLPTDTPATLQGRAGTFSSHQTAAPSPSTTIAFGGTAGVSGRYIRVQLTGADYLSLAEVQVFGTGGAPGPTNVALGRAATQSSTLPYATAGAGSAVDGNTDGAFFDGSVTATNLDPNPWWQVDLGASVSVSSMVIWNRMDCCGGRLSDYWVFVSNTPFLASDTPTTLQNRAGTFASHQTTIPSPSTTITAVAQGRYVRVQLSSPNYLSLAEVQVFGQ